MSRLGGEGVGGGRVMFLTFWSMAGSPGMSSGPFLGVHGSERFAKAADTGSEELRQKRSWHVATLHRSRNACCVVTSCVHVWGPGARPRKKQQSDQGDLEGYDHLWQTSAGLQREQTWPVWPPRQDEAPPSGASVHELST